MTLEKKEQNIDHITHTNEQESGCVDPQILTRILQADALRADIELIGRFERAIAEPSIGRQKELTEKALNWFVHNFGYNLPLLSYAFKFLELAAEGEPKGIPAQILDNEQLAVELSNLVHASSAERWTSSKIEELVKLSLTSQGQFKVILDKMITGVFHIPERTSNHSITKGVEQAVNLQYQAALAMVQTSDSKTRDELLAILCLEREVKPTCLAGKLIFAAPMSDQNSLIAKSSLVTAAVEIIDLAIKPNPQIEFSARTARVGERIRGTNSDTIAGYGFTDIASYITKIHHKDPHRFVDLTKYYEICAENFSSVSQSELSNLDKLTTYARNVREKARDHWVNQIPEYSSDPLSQRLMEKYGPQAIQVLKDFYLEQFLGQGFEQLTTPGLKVVPGFELQVLAKDCVSIEQRQALVREVYQSLINLKPYNPNREIGPDLTKTYHFRAYDLGYGDYFDQDQKIAFTLFRDHEQTIGALASVLKYYHPPLGESQICKSEAEIYNLQHSLHSFLQLVGERGYETVIPDPYLRDLGYKSLTFKDLSQSDTLSVNLKIENKSYYFQFDKRFQLLETEDIVGIEKADRVWLEFLVLSSLEKLLCAQDEEFEDKLLDPERQKPLIRKQNHGRRSERLGPIALNEQFSSEAETKFRQSAIYKRYKDVEGFEHYQSLESYNIFQDRIRGRQRLFTFISADRILRTENTAPVRIVLKDVTALIREVIPLDQYSAAEEQRIIDQMFAEHFADL